MPVTDRSPLLLLDRFLAGMVRSLTCRARIAALCLLVLAGWLSLADRADAASAALPEFAAVSQAVADYFDSLRGHQPTDLVTQSQVAEALDAVAEVGWDVPERDALVKRTLADGSFLVRELATPAGKKFMRNIARYPGAYNRLDRLSTISGGQKVVRQLIHEKGGYEMIEYMATTPGGHNLGKMMAGAQQGVDLNKPTGRIYTADDVVAALKKVYEETAP